MEFYTYRKQNRMANKTTGEMKINLYGSQCLVRTEIGSDYQTENINIEWDGLEDII